MAHQIFWHKQETYKRSFVNQVLTDTRQYHQCPPIDKLKVKDSLTGDILEIEGSPDDELTYAEIEAHLLANGLVSSQLGPDVQAGGQVISGISAVIEG